MTDGSGLDGQIAAFVSGFERPPSAQTLIRANALSAILDTIGVMVAGAQERAPRILAEVVGQPGGIARVPGVNGRFSAPDAALVGGTAAHVLDFDDVHLTARLGHPSAATWPALDALAHGFEVSGERILDAFAVGIEVGARLGRAIGDQHYQQGWHATGTVGAMRAAAAAARMLALNVDETSAALGLAASMASGVRANFGTMTKSAHAGNASRSGVIAALAAQAGFTASDDAVHGDTGFLGVFGQPGEGEDANDLWNEKTAWELESGLVWKRYPSCAASHSGIDAALAARDELQRRGVALSDVDRIQVGAGTDARNVLTYSAPIDGLQGKFSMNYCVAASLLDGGISLQSFTREAVARREIAALLQRLIVVPVEDLAAPEDAGARSAVVEIEAGGQHVARGYHDGAKSTTGRAPAEAHRTKFLDCMAYRGLAHDDARAVLGIIEGLGSAPSAREAIRRIHDLVGAVDDGGDGPRLHGGSEPSADAGGSK